VAYKPKSKTKKPKTREKEIFDFNLSFWLLAFGF